VPRRLLHINHFSYAKNPYFLDKALGDVGKFPKAVKLGHGERAKIAYVEEEIDAWIAERAALRNAE